MLGHIALDYLKAHIGPAGTLITIIITSIAYVGYLIG